MSSLVLKGGVFLTYKTSTSTEQVSSLMAKVDCQTYGYTSGFVLSMKNMQIASAVLKLAEDLRGNY